MPSLRHAKKNKNVIPIIIILFYLSPFRFAPVRLQAPDTVGGRPSLLPPPTRPPSSHTMISTVLFSLTGNTHSLSSRAFPPPRYLLCRPDGTSSVCVGEVSTPGFARRVSRRSCSCKLGGQHLLLKSKSRLRSRLRFRGARKTRAVTETIHSVSDGLLFYLILLLLSSPSYPSLLFFSLLDSTWSAVKTRFFLPTTTTSLVQPSTPRAPSQFQKQIQQVRDRICRSHAPRTYTYLIARCPYTSALHRLS